MNTKLITGCLLVGVGALLVGWDIYVASNSINGDTISEITLAFARKHPVVPFALGVLMGHLLWSQQ